MRPTFAGFETAKTGIFTSQSAINLTGHNIANAETPGYTRQRLDVEARMPYGTIMRLPPRDKGIMGNGVLALQVSQIRDSFLDREFRDHNTDVNYWSTKLDSMSYIESLFDPTDNEISKRLQGFFDSMSDISKYPERDGVRHSAKYSAQQLCSILNITSKQIQDRIQVENEQVTVNVNQINTLAERIANVNKQIYAFELSGHPANDLRDSLNLMLDELSGLADITYSTDSKGKMSVFIGGEALVTHNEYKQLESRPDADGNNQVYWAGTNDQPTLGGGELQGHIDMRDGDTDDNKGLAYYLNELDNFAKTLVEMVNDQHQLGYTNEDTPRTGINFFDPAGITAETITLSQDIMDNVNNIACASDKLGGTANNENALAIASLFEKGLDSMLRSYMSNIGSETTMVSDRAKTTLVLTQNTESMRLSVSAVSMDEEMTNLVKYQHSYSAAARALTTMDEALDVLINRTGKVGL